MNTRGGYQAFKVAKEELGDKKAQKYLKESLMNIINKLQ